MTYTDIKIQQKLTYLRRLLNIRVNVMKFVHSVEVTLEGDMVKVHWNVSRPDRYFSFEEKEFPVKDLGKMIAVYKRKVRNDFKNRHKNESN